jgi:hypothetical protein
VKVWALLGLAFDVNPLFQDRTYCVALDLNTYHDSAKKESTPNLEEIGTVQTIYEKA